mmetsp:Transcript_58621/g.154988  ORF Transcript_58621/g.154988 Transcript_58621/m.154988 type:complete len:563 (+) Transcript_58621:813-2501(+)
MASGAAANGRGGAASHGGGVRVARQGRHGPHHEAARPPLAGEAGVGDEHPRLAHLPRGLRDHDAGRARAQPHPQLGRERAAGGDPARGGGEGVQDAVADPDAVHPAGAQQPRRGGRRADGLGQDRRLRAAHARLHLQAGQNHPRERRRGPPGAGAGPLARAGQPDLRRVGDLLQAHGHAVLRAHRRRRRQEHRGAGLRHPPGRRGHHRHPGPPHRHPRAPPLRPQPVQLHRAGRGRPHDRHGLRAPGAADPGCDARGGHEARRGGRRGRQHRLQVPPDLHVLGHHAAGRGAHHAQVPAAARLRDGGRGGANGQHRDAKLQLLLRVAEEGQAPRHAQAREAAHHGVRQRAQGGGHALPRPRQAGLQGDGAARRAHPGGPRAGARRLQGRRGRHPRLHRRRRARHRHQRGGARDQLRLPQEHRGLHAPHRPHRARGQDRGRDYDAHARGHPHLLRSAREAAGPGPARPARDPRPPRLQGEAGRRPRQGRAPHHTVPPRLGAALPRPATPPRPSPLARRAAWARQPSPGRARPRHGPSDQLEEMNRRQEKQLSLKHYAKLHRQAN